MILTDQVNMSGEKVKHDRELANKRYGASYPIYIYMNLK